MICWGYSKQTESLKSINYEIDLVEIDFVFCDKNTKIPYTGPVYKLNDKGIKVREGYFKDGFWDGLHLYWYDDGVTLFDSSNWNQGLLNGKQTLYFENGQKEIEQNFTNNIKNGLYTEWYETGTKKQEGTFVNGLKEGKWEGWWMNQTTLYQGQYELDKMSGIWKYFYMYGDLERSVNCDKEECP